MYKLMISSPLVEKKMFCTMIGKLKVDENSSFLFLPLPFLYSLKIQLAFNGFVVKSVLVYKLRFRNQHDAISMFTITSYPTLLSRSTYSS